MKKQPTLQALSSLQPAQPPKPAQSNLEPVVTQPRVHEADHAGHILQAYDPTETAGDAAITQRREELSSTPCCWPLWSFAGRPTHEYCGAESRFGRPYCPKHCEQAFVPLTQKQLNLPTTLNVSGT